MRLKSLLLVGSAILLPIAAIWLTRSLAPADPSHAYQKVTAEDRLRLIFETARTQLSLGKTTEAIAGLNRILRLDPQNQEAHQLRGDAYYRRNEMTKAMADYAELRTSNGEFLAARTEQARLAAAAQGAVSTESAARNLAEQANTLAQTGHADEAIDLYTRVLQMEIPISAASTVCQNRGNAYRAKGEEEKAMRDYEQAIRFNPLNAGAYANRGLILFGRGDVESALKDYDEALRLDPKMYEALLNRGVIYRNAGELEKALADFSAAVRLNPDFASSYLNRGDIHLRLGRLEEALSDFAAAEKLDPTLADLHYGRALVLEKKRAYLQSISEFEKALQLGSAARAEILNVLAWLRATCPQNAVRDGKSAVAMALEACAAKYWNDARVVDTLAAAYAENGEFENAVKFQQLALTLPNLSEEDLPDTERRLALYEKRLPYRTHDTD